MKTYTKDTMILLAEYKELPDSIQLTKGRRPVYYTKRTKIPKKYQGCSFDKRGRLIDEEGNLIIKNQRFVDKPRTARINFNLFWSGVIHRSVRSKIKNELTDYFSKGLTKTKIKGFPLILHFEAYTQAASDVDNGSFIYIKAFFDTLTRLKLIPDDTRQYVGGYSWIHRQSDENKLIVKYATASES